ncbi:PREDICTED: uncharacterized protein LOC109462009 [Branchiostoma belcheri]|uniref:Uncharacterized protein LOC109462009 n=1 Tax=Branchiostoma belcheri TaxID=7741 RepID=A0A6P4XC25_BRABE|nr:PREDICTED: uncharacterized protein LOC109462009 [Branchiostoma belcheri]
MSGGSSSKAQKEMARSIVQKLRTAGVRLVALDWDRTIITVHTKGCWEDSPSKLAKHVRPCFKYFIAACLDSTLHLCVVTFSSQSALIKDTLKIAIPHSDTSAIIIRGNTKDWGRIQGVPILGKQQHIASAMREVTSKRHQVIQPGEVLLMDDDTENLKIAETFGHRAFFIRDDMAMEHFSDCVTEHLPNNTKPAGDKD